MVFHQTPTPAHHLCAPCLPKNDLHGYRAAQHHVVLMYCLPSVFGIALCLVLHEAHQVSVRSSMVESFFEGSVGQELLRLQDVGLLGGEGTLGYAPNTVLV